MKEDYKILNKFTFLYLYIPTVIFLFGWCKLYISIPLFILLSIILVKMFSNYKEEFNNEKVINYFKKNKKQILILLFISLLYVFLSGIGGYVYQNYDHIYRNSLFESMINNSWPILEHNGEIYMVYYFALWLPAALMGKIFGVEFGYFFFYIWCTIGVFLFFNYIKDFSKKHYLLPILIFVFFSGLDFIENFLYGGDPGTIFSKAYHIEWSTGYQFSSFTTQLFWVFNQCIPAWLLTFYILSLKDNRIIGLLIAMSLIFCTLPSVGLAILALYKIFYDNGIKKKDFKEWLKHTFTWENLLVGVPILIIFGLFVKSNAAGGVIIYGIPQFRILNYILTIIYEVGIYYFLVHKYHSKNPLFYVSFIFLLLCPMLSINGAGDFCMRASIPSLLVLYMFVVKTLDESHKKKDRKTFIALIMILAIGAITPLNEIRRTIINTNYYGGRQYGVIVSETYFGENFYGYTKDSIFCKYFMK